MIELQPAVAIGEDDQPVVAGRPGNFPIGAQMFGFAQLVEGFARAAGGVVQIDRVFLGLHVGAADEQPLAVMRQAVSPHVVLGVGTLEEARRAGGEIDHSDRRLAGFLARKGADHAVVLELALGVEINIAFGHGTIIGLPERDRLAAVGPFEVLNGDFGVVAADQARGEVARAGGGVTHP